MDAVQYAHIVKAVGFCAAAFAMSVGSIGPALGQGMVGKEACNASGRSPEHANNIRTTMMLGMGIIETAAIYNFIIAIIILIWS